MIEVAGFPVGSPEYRALGLIANPFRTSKPNNDVEDEVQIVAHAEAMRLVNAIDIEASKARSDVVWVTKSEEIPSYYSRTSLSEVMRDVTGNDDLELLLAYVPFVMMRTGRIRCALSMVAERLSGGGFDRTLAKYAAEALRTFDPELPTEHALSEELASEYAARFASEPTATAEAVFGECVDKREEEVRVEDLVQEQMREQGRQDADPDETEATAEIDSAEQSAEGAEEQPPTPESTVALYVIEHARKHLSPVIARGIEAYMAHGTYSCAQELKLTKAPRKTLGALGRLASYRYRKIVLIYDQFESWMAAPEELRMKIAAALSEVRIILGTTGVLTFLAGEDEIPEIETQFPVRRIEWTMRPLLNEPDPETGMPEGTREFAVEACRVPDGETEAVARIRAMLGEQGTPVAELGSRVDEMAAEAI